MFYEQAKRSYELQEANFVENIENNHEIVRLIFKELRKNLIIIVSDEEIELSKQARHYAKAHTALHLLLSSLDPEKGGEISENLAGLYLYVQQQLIEGRDREGFKGDPNIVDIVTDLLEAWEKI
ncbi:MAG: flagellar protein FliS [Parvibaculales bacterium]